MMNIKAIALLSGGLDSILSARLIIDQGITVVGASFFTPFNRGNQEDIAKHPASLSAKEMNIEFISRDLTLDFSHILKKPPHGYGSQMNPCLDCRILFFAQARKLMEEIDAKFIITGEILNQRPMSQKLNGLRMTERASGLEGLILRPLSALHLDPTIPELQGWVDRTKLMDIRGRSRKIQLQLAERMGIVNYSTPAGGCLLTDPVFSNRLKDLMENNQYSPEECEKLRFGRHFRLNPKTKLIIGRDAKDNGEILKLAKKEDIRLESPNLPGPTGLIVGDCDDNILAFAASAILTYIRSDQPDRDKIRIYNESGLDKIVAAQPFEDREIINKLMIL